MHTDHPAHNRPSRTSIILAAALVGLAAALAWRLGVVEHDLAELRQRVEILEEQVQGR